MQQRLILTRGIPASGKTTWAKAWVAAGENRVRINRDDIRMNVFGVEYGCDEKAVTKLQHALVAAALKAGYSVVCDDTNLRLGFLHKLADIALDQGIYVEVKDFNISLEEALLRNSLRDRKVPEDVIRKMYNDFLQLEPMTDIAPPKLDVYVPVKGTPKAIMVDIDGTLAKMVNRSPYDWHKVEADEVFEHVAEVVSWANSAGWDVVVMSGRDSVCRPETERWLETVVWYDRLFMRPEGDQRKDSIVKKELFDEHVRDFYDIQFVLDDRNQVVDMWRKLGLPCFQVAEGDF